MKARKLIDVDQLDWKKMKNLIPVIVQDKDSLQVITLAYVNKKAVKKTLETGYAHFYRRSFRQVMKKGKTSGNVQKVQEILIDCDQDALLYLIEPLGPGCHLGEISCFHNKLDPTI